MGNKVKNIRGASAIAIAGVGAAKGESQVYEPVNDGDIKHGLEIQCSGSAVAIDVKVLASNDNSNFVIPDDMAAAVISVSDTTLHIKALSPTVAKYYKLQIDGAAGNGADTTVAVLRVCNASR